MIGLLVSQWRDCRNFLTKLRYNRRGLIYSILNKLVASSFAEGNERNYAIDFKLRFEIRPLVKSQLEYIHKKFKIDHISMTIYSDEASLN